MDKRIRHTNKQARKQINKRTNKEEKTKKQRLLFFCLVRCNGWSHCVRSNDINKKTTSKHGRPREGAVFVNWNCQKTKLSSIWQFQIYGGSGWVGRPYMFMTLGSWICGVQTAGNRDDTQPLSSETHVGWGGGGWAHHIYQPWSGLDYRRSINRRFKQNTCRNKYGQGPHHCRFYAFL